MIENQLTISNCRARNEEGFWGQKGICIFNWYQNDPDEGAVFIIFYQVG